MARQYAPLQPSGRSVDSDAAPPAPEDLIPALREHELLEPPEPKRRRIGVTIACNECRRKKIRCDGQRPVCNHCTEKGGQCEYRDDIAISQESRKLLTEVVRILNRLPPISTIRVLDELNQADAFTILTTLRNRADAVPKSRESDEPGRYGSSADADSTLDSAELELHNPVAYPNLSRLGPNLMGNKSYRELIQSSISGSPASRLRSSAHPTPSTQQSPGSSSSETPNTRTSASNVPSVSDQPSVPESQPWAELCDPRLASCRISRWTDVEIDDEMAARCISLYLKTDHPLLGHFDPDLFLTDFVSENEGEHLYCSPLLQMYSAIDSEVDNMAVRFGREAERLWDEERKHGRDSILNMAAAEFLCLGYLGQGRDHILPKYLSEASEMGKRMQLFGLKNETPTTGMEDIDSDDNNVDDGDGAHESDDNRKLMRARMYAAWGVFNFATLMSFFYRQPGISILSSAPPLPIPKPRASSVSTRYMGHTFPHLCRFWRIIREVSALYYAGGDSPWASDITLFFAEFKFRELLAWSNSLPLRLSSNHGDRPHHVEVMHLWFHAAILDIFRPFIYDTAHRDRRLRTFASGTITPKVIYTSSTTRLKHLILGYRLNYASSSYTILWHTALLYAANALLEATALEQKDRYEYILLFLYGYVRLSSAWRVAKAISKGLLSMILRQGDMSSDEAWQILGDLDDGRVRDDEIAETIRATFMLDLQNAPAEPGSSTVEKLADDFEGNAMMMEYTNVMGEEGLE